MTPNITDPAAFEPPREENRGRLQNLVVPAWLPDPFLELDDGPALLRGSGGVDLSLVHPGSGGLRLQLLLIGNPGAGRASRGKQALSERCGISSLRMGVVLVPLQLSALRALCD